MPRFFLSGGSSIAGGTAFILGEDAAHAKVLRLRVGDTMIVCDGGKDHHCTVTKITPNEVEAEIFEVVPCQGEPSVHTVILAGLPKGSEQDRLHSPEMHRGGRIGDLFLCLQPVRGAHPGRRGQKDRPLGSALPRRPPSSPAAA